MAAVVRMPTAMALRPVAQLSASAASRQVVQQQRAFGAVAKQRAGVLSAAREQRKSIVDACRRGYADQAPVKELPKKKKRAGVLRWTWRLTYMSAIGLLGWTAYGIYLNRNPVEQPEPDPSKKTLVVLGEFDVPGDPLVCAGGC